MCEGSPEIYLDVGRTYTLKQNKWNTYYYCCAYIVVHLSILTFLVKGKLEEIQEDIWDIIIQGTT